MPRVDVVVHATAGSSIGRQQGAGSSPLTRHHHTDGWPVGLGQVDNTRGAAGDELEALVLMAEPAMVGVTVHAWPVGVLFVEEPTRRQLLLCVAEDEPFMDLVDVVECGTWHTTPHEWLDALNRLGGPARARHAHCEGHEAAAQILYAAQRRVGATGATTI